MEHTPDAIYLSPHLDDVVLSCGGQIYAESGEGQRILVVTVMAGDPPAGISGYAQGLQERWNLATDAGAGRRAEDVEACRMLGAEALHWAIPDCIYRTDPATGAPLYLSDDDIFAEIHPAEQDLIDQVSALLASLPAAGRMVAPLVVGHHVDHQIVRLAAERCFAETLLYYEDYPYAQEPGAVEKTLAATQGQWAAQEIPLDAAARQAKIEAILAYRSQLSTFWKDRQDLQNQIEEYTAQVGGERLWLKQARPQPG